MAFANETWRLQLHRNYALVASGRHVLHDEGRTWLGPGPEEHCFYLGQLDRPVEQLTASISTCGGKLSGMLIQGNRTLVMEKAEGQEGRKTGRSSSKVGSMNLNPFTMQELMIFQTCFFELATCPFFSDWFHWLKQDQYWLRSLKQTPLQLQQDVLHFVSRGGRGLGPRRLAATTKYIATGSLQPS